MNTSHHRLTHIVSLITLMGTCVALSSCGPDFDPYWRTNKLRLISMRSDPATLKPFQTASLEALVANPANDELTYTWEWCPFGISAQQEYKCPVTRDELVEVIAQGVAGGNMGDMMMGPDGEMMPMDELPPDFDFGVFLPEFQLGNGTSAELVYPLAGPEFVLGLCQGLQEFLGASDLTGDASVTSSCEEGFDVTMRVEITGGDESEIGAKRFTLWTGSEFDNNKNPVIEAIDIRLANEDDAAKLMDKLPWLAESAGNEDRWHRMPADEPLPVVANMSFEVRASVDPQSVEVWQRPAPQGSDLIRLPEEREGLEFRWFVAAGTLSDSRQLFGAESAPLDEVPITTFTVSNDVEAERCYDEDKNMDGCTSSIWSVVNDGRLGVGWIKRQVLVLDAKTR